MELTGRVVANATVRKTNNDRTVTGFRIAINRSYVSQGEPKQETAYVDCNYWRTEAIAPYLTKGMLVQVHGFMTAEAWLNKEGEPMASLKFRTDEINLLTASEKPQKGNGKAKHAGDPRGVMQPSDQFN